jgi:hypothetical protein
MPNCLVIDNATGLVINRIVADPVTDIPPDGCRIELEPEPIVVESTDNANEYELQTLDQPKE